MTSTDDRTASGDDRIASADDRITNIHGRTDDLYRHSEKIYGQSENIYKQPDNDSDNIINERRRPMNNFGKIRVNHFSYGIGDNSGSFK